MMKLFNCEGAQLNPSILKILKVIIILLVGRVKNPFLWTLSFCSNPLIRNFLHQHPTMVKARSERSRRKWIENISNALTCGFIYAASVGNEQIAKDYWSMYLFTNYYGVLNTPSEPDIIMSPFSSVIKVKRRSRFFQKVYENKEYVTCPIIFAQFLSNYLTPTSQRLNQRYLPPFIKRNLINPIWINFSLSPTGGHLHWRNMLEIYLLHNILGILVIAGGNFKSKFLDKYYALKYCKIDDEFQENNLFEISKRYILYVIHRANAWVNFIYLPNIISMLLISLTAPSLKLLGSSKFAGISNFFKNHTKLVLKTYIKAVGFSAAVLTLYGNQKLRIPSWGYEDNYFEDDPQCDNVRHISKSWLGGLDLYMLRLIIISKWRILKRQHASFKKIRVIVWERLETALMCLGVFKLMCLNDFVKKHSKRLSQHTRNNIKNDNCIQVLDHIM